MHCLISFSLPLCTSQRGRTEPCITGSVISESKSSASLYSCFSISPFPLEVYSSVSPWGEKKWKYLGLIIAFEIGARWPRKGPTDPRGQRGLWCLSLPGLWLQTCCQAHGQEREKRVLYSFLVSTYLVKPWGFLMK